jgi:UDP-N-acetylglucosamine 2-epimerase (non-hydrolysing)/GDP/UDP-N,N'-diacetylbacillosamine 2-epimerase (hydrolysing)
MKKICIVTGSRAEYGLLKRLMSMINSEKTMKLQIIVTNMHLCSEFGNTYKEIESDGFIIDKKIEMLLSSDTPSAITKSFGLATIGFADAFIDLQPDMLLVLGDRSEILAAATSALFFKIPVVHLHGGEISEGAYDESIRHAISKMSHIHFTSTIQHRERVLQLGEDPEMVHNVGAIGVDNIKHLKLISKSKLENELNFNFSNKVIIVTYHPTTNENENDEIAFLNILKALDYFKDVKIIFTLPNSDTNNNLIKKLIIDYVNNNTDRAVVFASLGQLKYYSTLMFVDAVVGNSSSGIIEAPSFGVPTINIGNRQKGRTKGSSVFDTTIFYDQIRETMYQVLYKTNKNSFKNSLNPYDKAGTAANIIAVLKNVNLDKIVLKKFHTV